MKRVQWLDQLQHEARKFGLTPNRRTPSLLLPKGSGLAMPVCERCGGAPLHALNIEDAGETWIELVGHHLHRGSRMPADDETHRWTNEETDYFRIDFERKPTPDDVRRALRSAVLFRSEHTENDAAKR